MRSVKHVLLHLFYMVIYIDIKIKFSNYDEKKKISLVQNTYNIFQKINLQNLIGFFRNHWFVSIEEKNTHAY